MLDLSDFCSPLVTQKQFWFNCTGKKAMCFIKCAVGLVRTVSPVEVSRIPMKELMEDSGLYVPSTTYYTCDPLPQEWLDMIPNLRLPNLRLPNPNLNPNQNPESGSPEAELSSTPP